MNDFRTFVSSLISWGVKKLASFAPKEASSPTVAEAAEGRINDKVAIVYAHGGSWYQGSPEEINAYRDLFPGVHIESVDYSLFPNATNARQVDEVCAAVEGVKKKYGRVFLMGYSAGGQLAVLASRKTKVEGVICISGAVDFSATVGLSLFPMMFTPQDPYTNAESDTTRTLLVHGTDDKKVLVGGAERYQKRHKNCRLVEVPGKGHTLELLRLENEAIKTWMTKVR